MPLAPNFLLQSTTPAKAPPSNANIFGTPAKVSEASTSGASSFANVYAKQTQTTLNSTDATVKDSDAVAKTPPADAPDGPTKVQAGADKSTASKPDVADTGKDLPAKTAASDSTDTGKTSTGKTVAKKTADDSDDDTPQAASTATPVAPPDPTLDPMVMLAMTGHMPDTQPAAPPTTATTAATSTAPAASATDPQAALAAATGSAVATTPAATSSAADTLAAAASGTSTTTPGTDTQVSGTAAEHAKGSTDATTTPNTPGQDFANLLSGAGQQPSGDKSSDGKGGGDADSAALALGVDATGGAKDSGQTGAASFTDKLNALGQAVAPRAAAATTAATSGQPLAMNQSGWTEAVVDRVMYLSSQNLKSAEIQLQPAELGRLDVRVDMSATQTQVSFVSAHPGVREALDNNLPKLREMFAQQGLAQPDVNVSDQSRGWSQNQQNQQAQDNSGSSRQGSGGRGGSGSGSDSDDDLPLSVSSVSSAATVIGSSAVDYYA